MQKRYIADRVRFERMNTTELRDSYLLGDLFQEGEIGLYYTDVDRAIVGGIVPLATSLELKGSKEMAAEYFTQRREIGIMNIGSPGSVSVDGKSWELENKDCLYIGRGAKEILFQSTDSKNPAVFYLLSYPAHQSHPTTLAKKKDTEKVELGSLAESNARTIYKYIHPAGIKSCQLVMGYTELAEGSVWNTMAAHTHERRTEVYMYFDIPEDAVVFHLMGPPEETRHIVIRDKQAVLSPSWSIHAGSGTRSYTFIWGMGGENQEFGDMDGIDMDRLK